MFTLYVPKSVQYYLLLNQFYYFIFSKNNNFFIFSVMFNANIYCSILRSIIYINTYYLALQNLNIFKFLSYFIFSWGYFIVRKLKFKHKGGWFYYSKKIWSRLKLNFGFSDYLHITNNQALVKRHKKHFKFHTLTLCLFSKRNSSTFLQKLINFFKLNIFTFRGIRLGRQKVYKKQGKVSKYMTFLKK
jgi:hypothetical protein